MRFSVIFAGLISAAGAAFGYAQDVQAQPSQNSEPDFGIPHASKSASSVSFSGTDLPAHPVKVVQGVQDKPNEAGDILDVVKGDWNSDGDEDFAVLTASKDGGVGGATATLSIYERYPEAQVKHVMSVTSFFLAWGHSHLTKSSETSFQVGYGNINGRSNWRNELTIAFRDGQYVVAGYTSDANDGMAPENAVYCDVNLLTGQYEIVRGTRTESFEAEVGQSEPEWFALKDLAENLNEWGQYTPSACSERRGAY